MSPFIALLAQIAAAPPVYVSPPIVSASPGNAVERYAADVEIRGGATLLWSGTVQIGGGTTNLSFRLSEPGPECGPGPGERVRGSDAGYTLSLFARAGRAGEQLLEVNAGWTRSDPAGCALPTGSRTVSFSQVTRLPPGTPVVLRGDGGLMVTLRRR